MLCGNANGRFYILNIADTSKSDIKFLKEKCIEIFKTFSYPNVEIIKNENSITEFFKSDNKFLGNIHYGTYYKTYSMGGRYPVERKNGVILSLYGVLTHSNKLKEEKFFLGELN